MKKFLYRLVIEEDGPTAVEYAVMLALIAGAVLGSVSLMSNQTAASFDSSATSITNAFGS